MIIVETPVSTLDRESSILSMLEGNPMEKIYMMGAMHAIWWVKNGGKSPSEIVTEAKNGIPQ